MSDVELTDAEREALRRGVAVRVITEDPDDSYTRIGDPTDYEPVFERILAARLSQEREQVRAERDREWQRHLNALPDEMAEAWGGDAAWLTSGSKVATLVGDWLADLHYDLAEDGPRPAQEGELCSTCGGSSDSPPCSLNRGLGLGGHTRAGGVVAADVSPHPSPDSHEWLGMDR